MYHATFFVQKDRYSPCWRRAFYWLRLRNVGKLGNSLATNGDPLYNYTHDTATGQMIGEGGGGVWDVVALSLM